MSHPLLQSIDNGYATFSPDRVYRYALWRRWGEGPGVLWVMLNPSTADEVKNDPTVRRCIGYTRAWKYNAVVVGNIFALRATDPKELYRSADPVGPDNNDYLCSLAGGAALIVCAWGTHGDYEGRGTAVHELLADVAAPKLHVLGLTKHGHPVHPLYQKASLLPQAWKV